MTGYRFGGGARGNVGARTLTAMRTSVPFVVRRVNLRPATGGVDAETVDKAKVRGPLTLRTGQRAVTAGDFERLTHRVVDRGRPRALPAVRRRGRGRSGCSSCPQVRTDPTAHKLDDFALAAAADAPDHRAPRRAPHGRHRDRGGNARTTRA